MKRLIAAVVILALLMVMLPAQSVLAADGVVEVQVEAGSDDILVYYNSAALKWDVSITNVTQQVGWSSESCQELGGGMRFTGIGVPQGAKIEKARLDITAKINSPASVVKSRICGEDVDDASKFYDFSNYRSRRGIDGIGGNVTSKSVVWDSIEKWSAAVVYKSPDISKVVQEIIDRPGWDFGNSIVIFWDDHEGRSDSRHAGYSYEGAVEAKDKLRAPKLYIEYTYDGAYYEDGTGELETQIESLETQISTLNTRMAELGGMIVVFRGYVTDLGKESGLLRGGYTSLHTEIAGFETSLEYIKGVVADLETETGASGRLLALEERLGEQLGERLSQLEEHFAEVESGLSGKLTLLIWLVALPLILLIAVAGYSILRRQR